MKNTMVLSFIVVVCGWAKLGTAQPVTNNASTAIDVTGCVNEVEEVPNEPRVHIPEDQTPVYNHNPPVSGQHYEVWGRWRIHPDLLARGYWGHNLEHGGVIFLYRPDAPQDLVDALIRVYNAIPNDDPCEHPRAVLTADSLLDVPWAVTVSGREIDPESGDLGVGYVIKADCIESEQALVDFAVQYRKHSVEDTCEEGQVPRKE